MDTAQPSAELRWFWHGTVLALELWDDHGAYSLSEHHTRVARGTGALSQLALALSSHTPVLVFRGDISAAEYAVGEAEADPRGHGHPGRPLRRPDRDRLAWSGSAHQGPR